jgi:hypothetical protein
MNRQMMDRLEEARRRLARLVADVRGTRLGGRARQVAMLLQPPLPPGGRGRAVQSAVAVGALIGVLVTSGVAVGALAVLLLALCMLYLMLTRVLGIELQLDPRAPFTASAAR